MSERRLPPPPRKPPPPPPRKPPPPPRKPPPRKLAAPWNLPPPRPAKPRPPRLAWPRADCRLATLPDETFLNAVSRPPPPRAAFRPRSPTLARSPPAPLARSAVLGRLPRSPPGRSREAARSPALSPTRSPPPGRSCPGRSTCCPSRPRKSIRLPAPAFRLLLPKRC